MEHITAFPVKLSGKSKGTHYMYLKPHKVKNSASEKPSGRTLLVLGVPPYANKDCIERLFYGYGEIQSIFIQKKPSSGPPSIPEESFFNADQSVKGFKVAYIVFSDEKTVDNIIKDDHNEAKILSTKKNPILTGLRKWMNEYNAKFIDPTDVQKEVDSYLDHYDKSIEEEKEKAKENEADEDGWIKVNRSKHGNTSAWTETITKKVSKKEKAKRAQKELMNFYAFQIRESKMQHIAQMRQKFEEDKQRIMALKESRKFRPY